MKKSAILILLAVSIFLVSISTTLAWFANISYIDNDNLTASAITGYFRSGDGSSGNPFVISTPRHLYNLAWLQYLGELNKVDKNTGKITQYYFKLEDLDDGNADNVIDVDGLVLPPIGTTENPFVGHFDGNGVCIQNLTVSNYLSTNTGGIVERPLSVTTINETTTSIIGFFGVVGAVSEEMQALLIKEDEDADFRSRVNSVHDLFLENLTVRTESTTSLIGLLAGYVNGSVGNVGIGKSSIELGENVRPLTNSEVVKITSLISSYSLIGECNDANVFWIDVPKKTWGDSDDPDSGVGWGGSLDMLEINTRISEMFEKFAGTSTKYTTYTAIDDAFNINFYSYQAGAFNEKTVGHIAYICGASSNGFTYLPLNVNYGNYVNKDSAGNIVSVDYAGYYKNNTTETPVDMNTGYLVGAKKSSGSAVRTRVEQYSRVFNSLNLSKQGTITYQDNPALDILTVKGGTWYLISDQYNQNSTLGSIISGYTKQTPETLGLTKYIKTDDTGTSSGVRVSLANMLTNNQYLQGLHFMKFIPQGSSGIVTREDLLSIDAIATVDNANGYVKLGSVIAKELVAGSINFHVAGDGIITVMAGSTMQTSQNSKYSLFDLYKVDRYTDGTIKQLTEISTIHYDEQTKQYSYNKATTNDIVYSSSWTALLPVNNAMYYFEIPVSEGEYAIASKSGANDGAYLYYLDLGANGDQSTEDTTGTEATHSINGLTFVNMNNLEQITVDGKDINSTNGYKVTVFEIDMPTAKDHGGLTMTYERTADKVMTHTENDPSNAFTVQWTESDPVATQSLQLGQVILANPKRREDSA